MSNPRVFISYSQDSEEHRERVRGLHASLSRDGCDCRIDAYKDTDEDWPLWMTRQLDGADFILCVITETYTRRFSDRELPNVGLGAGWEAGLIRRLLYAKKLHNDRIFPAFFADQERPHIPLELQGYDHFLLDGAAGYEALLRKIVKKPQHIRPAIGTTPNLVTSTTAPLFPRPSAPSPSTSTVKADISRILKYAPADLIGRENELNLLTAAWKGDLQGLAAYPVISIKHRPKVLSFVALGGEGKTSLVAKWAAELAAQGWPGCAAAFAWSFYSQGTKDQTAASSDLFLKEALFFFAASEEDKQFAASNAGAFEKGQRLARIVGGRRCLLILDGLEPLQYAPTSPTPGELKDQGIAALLKGLATASHGLCVVTTRYSVPDLKAFWQTTAPEMKLLRLSRAAGVHLLKSMSVNGSERRNLPLRDDDQKSEQVNEFEKLVEDVKGHALTLTLLGGFLRRAFHGDIRQRDRVKFEKADERMDGGHAFRTMAAYEQWLLRDGGDEGRREVAVLRLLGLFDRPADADCLGALRRETIPGLTEPLAGLADDDWEYCLSGLEAAKLLTVNRDASGALISLDAHPHLREYFARQLLTHQPDAWRAAHRRLYEHLCATTSDKPQPTLEDLQPLYQAVAHGCQAGLQQEVCDKVYLGRITRGNEKYPMRKLGAFGSDLGALACFFEKPWTTVSNALSEAVQPLLLNFAGFRLRALGRLNEALEPMRVALEKAITQVNWESAAARANNLSELELMLGEVAGAVGDAEQSVTYADRSGDVFERITTRIRYGQVLLNAGKIAEASEQFEEGNNLGSSGIYGAFLYSEFRLAECESTVWRHFLKLDSAAGYSNFESTCEDVAAAAIKSIGGSQSLLDAGLSHLVVVSAKLYRSFLSSAASFPSAEIGMHLVAAVKGLRESGNMDELPRGLLTRAWCSFAEASFFAKATKDESAHKLRGDAQEAVCPFSRAQEDLDEAWEIAERGPMRLFLVDIHLYRARLFGRMKDEGGRMKYPWESPEVDLAAAEKLINDCGYHRRDEELADAKAVILAR